MRKFFGQMLLFLTPFLILLGLPLIILIKTGELANLKSIIELQKKSDKLVLYGRVYTDSHYDKDYKIGAILERKPNVLFLGTSRVLGYRSVFFKEPHGFYNAGRSITKINDLTEVLQTIPASQTPRIILVSLDPFFFFNEWKEDPNFVPNEHVLTAFFKHSWRLVYTDYFYGKFTLAQAWQKHTDFVAIGINAVVNRKGFRNDGSYLYGDVVLNAKAEEEYKELKEEIKTKVTPATCQTDYYGQAIRPEALADLQEFLELARARNTEVIGFISPYSPGVYDKIQKFNDTCSHMDEALNLAVAKVFTEVGANFNRFSDLTKVGATDAEFFDAVHYSEKLSLRLLIALGEQNKTLASYLDLPDLRLRLKKSTDNFTVFPQP